MVIAVDFFWLGLLESVTVTSTENLPPDSGVPVMMPVDAVSVSPGGKLPELILQE